MNSSKLLSIKRHIFFYIVFAILFSLVSFVMIMIASFFEKPIDKEALTSDPEAERKYPTVIIDAGHGGEDGGAVGTNGVYEKDLNLLIASDLRDMLKASGVNVIMTRETDTMLYDKSVDYKGRKKLLDLAARLKLAESYENCIFISIHMNSFPQGQYNGLQVYYSPNDESSVSLAEMIQSSVRQQLQPKNDRKTKKASSNIYLLDRINSPAVLIECGFISNSEECLLLCTEEYRQKLTLTMFCGINRFICEYNS